MSKMRIENDSMGNIEVPENALYGAQTQRAIENFDYSTKPMPEGFILALAEIKKAAARANGDLETMTKLQSNAIVKACDQILANGPGTEFPVPVYQTGSGTSSNMNMNEVLAKLANDHIRGNGEYESVSPNDHVNYGQSSNDVIPSSIQLSMLVAIEQQLIPAFQHLDKQFISLMGEHKAIVKTGRTHLMDAMPLRLSDELATWRFQISECRDRIASATGRLAELPLGGTAIGTGINRPERYPEIACDYLSKQTNIALSPCENLATRIAAQDAVLEMHGHLKVLATVVTKQMNDLRWMNSGPNVGLAEIQLKALQPGSSIMPGKVNPVIPESILMMCTQVLGNDTTLSIANMSGNFQLNVMLPLIAEKSLESIQLMSDSLNAMAEKALVDISVNHDKLDSMLQQNPILATALNTKIGYERAAKIAKEAYQQKRPIIDVAEEMTSLSRAELEDILDPIKMARPFD